MNDKIKGAWVIRHARQLQSALSQDFNAVGLAGKSGTCFPPSLLKDSSRFHRAVAKSADTAAAGD